MKKVLMMSLYFSVSSAWAITHGLIATNQTLPSMPQISFKKLAIADDRNFVAAGGYGGNLQTGRFKYSGFPDLPALIVARDPNTSTCYLYNRNVVIVDNHSQRIINFNCSLPDENHNNLYWSGNLGEVNGGYSPENDTLYGVDVVTNMFKEWYQIPPLSNKKGLQTPVTVFLHDSTDNAYFVDEGFVLGDGYSIDYPLTSLNVISYMMGGLFTAQHSRLDWGKPQTGGIDVAFDCMTAMAAEYYVTGRNTWQVGATVNKKGSALHYLDQPSKNCQPHQKPGDYCDVDTLAQYQERPGMLAFYSAGLFNRAFYFLATTNGWNTRKAYDVFVRANLKHWKSNTNFHSGACDAVLSAQELGYDKMSVMIAFSQVGIDTRDC